MYVYLFYIFCYSVYVEGYVSALILWLPDAYDCTVSILFPDCHFRLWMVEISSVLTSNAHIDFPFCKQLSTKLFVRIKVANIFFLISMWITAKSKIGRLI